MPPLSDRWLDFRDALLTSPRFHTWAATSVFTRRIAQKRARAVFDLCAGFVYSQILSACVDLGLFDILKREPQTAADLAHQLQLPHDSMVRLLDAAVSLGLVSKRSGGRFGLGAHGAALIANPGAIAMIKHHKLFYADLADPLALLHATPRETELARFWKYARSPAARGLADSEVEPYTALMSASQSLVGGGILDSYDVGQHRVMLDIGGGDGTFAENVASCEPDLRIMLFDLPAVAARAAQRFERAGLSHRTQAISGDFTFDALPRGADLVTLVRVLHDHDDASVQRILTAAHTAMAPGSTLLVAEPLAGTAGAEPMADAYFAFYLMAMGSGRPRTFESYAALMTAAGFKSVALIATPQPLQTALILAKC